MARTFSHGEYDAARMYIAVLAKHSYDNEFDPEEIGITFTGADLPVAVTDSGHLVTTKDFIRAALRIIQSQFEQLSSAVEVEILDLVSHLALAVAKEDPGNP